MTTRTRTTDLLLRCAAAGCLAIVAAAASARASEGTLQLKHRWVYLSTNMLVDRNVESAIRLMARSAAAGYNGVVLCDSKFMRWDNLPARYARNVAKVRRAAGRLKLDLIPGVMPIGYSGSLLSRDPNLAAGLPVVDAPFEVRGGRLVPADRLEAANPSFEKYKGHRPTGWRYSDQPGKITFIDTKVFARGKASLRMQDIERHNPKHGNARVMQVLKVKPFRYYHVSAMVKTEGFTAAGQVRILLLAGGRTLSHNALKIAPTQDFKRVGVAFNSLDNTEINLYLGVWQGKRGKIWWDDVRIEPGGWVNLIRRKGAPLNVTSADGKTIYAESRDFQPPRDPLMGSTPYAGAYSVWHARPAVRVTPSGRLKNGQRVLVDYYHTAMMHGHQVMCCMSEPGVYKALDWQIAQVKKNLGPAGYFMQHDEIRIQGWDKSCTDRRMTPGQVLADNIRRCTAIITKHDPGKPIYVWSDMFDPHHNARKTGKYYLVKGVGPWHGSWEGLAPKVTVVNWHGHAKGRLESLQHFASRGHKQILAGYYDSPPRRITEWLKDAAKVKGVVGVMYTTWRRNYDDLEAFARCLEDFSSSSSSAGK